MPSDKLYDLIESVNIAEDLPEDLLTEIGVNAHRGYVEDLASREEWEERNDEWMKLAAQVMESKSFPWENASNVKYPLLTTAAIQFHARAYPALVPSDSVVKIRVLGEDPTGEKNERAVRVGQHMSYQLLEEMPNWEEDMDRLCLTLPIIGCMFKKTYYSNVHSSNVSELVYPKHLVVNYWTKTLEDAYRKTHILELNSNKLIERIRAGIYRDVDLGTPRDPEYNINVVSDEITGITPPSSYDLAKPYTILEQHTYLDLDEDGYEEPYIITFEESSREVLRIVANYDETSVVYNEKDEISKITPFEHFTKFSFIPNPDGGFYDVGFGILLGPINEAANTIINQLVDAGTLSNLQSGFLGRGIKLKKGDANFKPGEWKTINATGDDLRKSILPLPVREPSGILFQLLSTLLESGQRLASTTDMMVGENPGQNQKATTTMAVLENGMKVFTAIYKRIHRALKKEYKKLFKLNSQYMDIEQYFALIDPKDERVVSVGLDDYNVEGMDVIPSADPTVITEAQRMAKAQALVDLIPLGVNPQVALVRVLEAQEQYNIEELLQPMETGPDPEMELRQAELQINAALKSRELDLKEAELQQKGMIAIDDARLKERAQTESEYKTATESQKKGSFEYNYGGERTK